MVLFTDQPGKQTVRMWFRTNGGEEQAEKEGLLCSLARGPEQSSGEESKWRGPEARRTQRRLRSRRRRAEQSEVQGEQEDKRGERLSQKYSVKQQT